MKSELINELATALAKAQSEMHGAKKNSENPFFKSTFADLESVWDACREPLTKNNLSIVQYIWGTNLITLLLHSSGQWIQSDYPLKPVKDDPQGMGSAISYARRYSLAAMVGVYQTDDDAELAQNRKENQSIVYDQTTAYFEPLPAFDEIPESKPKLTKTSLEEIKEFTEKMSKKAQENYLHNHIWKPNKYGPGQYCSSKLPNGEYCKEKKNE